LGSNGLIPSVISAFLTHQDENDYDWLQKLSDAHRSSAQKLALMMADKGASPSLTYKSCSLHKDTGMQMHEVASYL